MNEDLQVNRSESQRCESPQSPWGAAHNMEGVMIAQEADSNDDNESQIFHKNFLQEFNHKAN